MQFESYAILIFLYLLSATKKNFIERFKILQIPFIPQLRWIWQAVTFFIGYGFLC